MLAGFSNSIFAPALAWVREQLSRQEVQIAFLAVAALFLLNLFSRMTGFGASHFLALLARSWTELVKIFEWLVAIVSGNSLFISMRQATLGYVRGSVDDNAMSVSGRTAVSSSAGQFERLAKWIYGRI